ncbi:MAG: glycosyl hydrolase family 28-related protein [Bryobacteraceae bacterium]|nr:glycosyl hydrolase family 28-related protein [Bryobacteraceae bacterium]
MITRFTFRLLLSLSILQGQEDIPIANWAAPAAWSPESTAKGPRAAAISGPLTFVAVTPCRVADTRNFTMPSGFGQPIMAAGAIRTFNIPGNAACGIPASAQAYSLNFTVVPSEPLGYLSTWPNPTRPAVEVSTLNSFEGKIVANAAVVPAGIGGAIDVFVTNPTHVIIDINGYYAATNASATGTLVLPAQGCAAIQTAINATPAAGGIVQLAEGTYTCSSPIVIDRDNVVLRGAGPGTQIVLASGANSPLLILGQTTAQPSVTRRNIVISDLTLDGNRTAQTVECNQGPCTAGNFLRNNCITLRRVSDVRVERVTALRARSGGLVTELGCRRVTVRDFSSGNNHFDGLAGYQTENSLFSGLHLFDNLAAGISLDIEFHHNTFEGVVITGSGTVGIFMRDSRNNLFSSMQIRGSVEHGVFLAQVDSDPTKPALGNTFHGLTVANSAQSCVRINNASCTDNVFTAVQCVSNGSCISEAAGGLATQAAVKCR